LLFVALAILLAPTIISTSPVRAYVLSRLNQDLNGVAEIDDWSIGWIGGIDIRGIRLKDAQGRLIFECAHASAGLSLLDALRGRYDLYQTILDEPNFVIFDLNTDGSNNFQNLFKNSQTDRREGGRGGGRGKHSVHFSGDIQANRARATLVLHKRDGQTHTLIVDPSTLKIDLTNLDVPIHHDLSLHLRTLSSESGEILTLQGTAGLNDKGEFQIDDLLSVTFAGAAAPAARLKLNATFTGGFPTGGLPTGIPFDQAIQSLAGQGSVGVESLDFDGLRIENAIVPLQLSKGVLSVQGGAPIACNDGQIDLTGLKITLDEAHPRLTLPPNSPLARGVTLNIVMADKLLGVYASPVFLHPDAARGLLNVTIISCQRLPLDGLIASSDAANDGSAEIAFSIDEAKITGGFLADFVRGSMLPHLLASIKGGIPDAHLAIAQGRISQTVPVQVGKFPPLLFDGLLTLSTMSYDHLNIEMSNDLLRLVDKSRAAAFPNGWTFKFYGPAKALKTVKGTGPGDLWKALLRGSDKDKSEQP
jgi:hypothetical protein